VLCQPEFSELHQVQTIIHLWKKSKTNSGPIFKEPGEEKQSDGQRFGLAQKTHIRTCTLISSTYRRGSVPVGSVECWDQRGWIMKLRLLVEAAADYLSEALS